MTLTPSDQFGLFRYTPAFINYLSFKIGLLVVSFDQI